MQNQAAQPPNEQTNALPLPTRRAEEVGWTGKPLRCQSILWELWVPGRGWAGGADADRCQETPERLGESESRGDLCPPMGGVEKKAQCFAEWQPGILSGQPASL